MTCSLLANGVFLEQQELHDNISQSRLELEVEDEDEERRVEKQRSYGREMEQRARLASLGLDEVEAVEYVLMVSRDEEEWRRAALAADREEGVFATDSDNNDIDDSSIDHAMPPIPDLTPLSISRRSSSGSQSCGRMVAVAGLGVSASTTSNRKVQVSPRFRPEPMKAGVPPGPFSLDGTSPVRTDDEGQFPAIGAGVGRSVKNDNNSNNGGASSNASAGVSVGASPSPSPIPNAKRVVKSSAMWSAPLVVSRSAGRASGVRESVWATGRSESRSGTSSAIVNPSAASDGRAVKTFDEELRLAIELSLMEAGEGC